MRPARDSFPRQHARTRRFTLGRPHGFQIADNGSRIAFLRSKAGDDPITCLWLFDVASGEERLVCDPRDLDVRGGELPSEERAHRERTREMSGGIVEFAANPALERAAFALDGALFLCDLTARRTRRLEVTGPVFDPRIDPSGHQVAFICRGALHLIQRDRPERVLASDDDPDVTWGMAEFVAAEEMDRARGYWWAPDGTAIVAARVDVREVQPMHIANPADPARPPTVVHYPAAGTANADVSLAVISLEDGGGPVGLEWDRDAYPYLVRVGWPAGHPITLLVQSRDQRSMLVLTADARTGATDVIHEARDPLWLDIVDGVPDWLADGRLVFTQDREDTRRLLFGEEPVTPPGLQVRAILDVDQGALIAASEEPTEVHLWQIGPAGDVVRLTAEPGVHGGAAGGGIIVVTSATATDEVSATFVLREGQRVAQIPSMEERPLIRAHPRFHRLGGRELRSALFLPSPATGGAAEERLPVLVDPYGGPHAQRVVASRGAHLVSQWFADQGFAVLVADGRGTPGRGPAWEKAVRGDFATAPMEDQVEALIAAGQVEPRMDLTRVAIRGWSFGGYLAALAVLRRPDVFHAAIVGAPVTDWRLYDTHYTERYLGRPDEDPEAYRRSSVLDDAARLERPLMLIHGLADDNVLVANSLRFSRALLEAGRPHEFLPLLGVTHMTPQEHVAENLLILQVQFLRRALAAPS
jgi:dipeptidyl-peptidase-4